MFFGWPAITWRRAFTALVLSIFLLPLVLSAQERVHERVEVIYQEILVRVFDGTKAVPGLKAGDFALYEDGRPVKVSYCRELRRSLARPEIEPAGVPAAEKAKPRLFLFMLWFNEESRDWPRAWDYFLEEIYRAGDRIVLSDGTRVMEVSSPEKDEAKISAFFAAMAAGLKKKKLEKTRLVNDLERSTRDFYENLIFIPAKDQEDREAVERALLGQFMTSYLGALDEYRLARLKGYPGWLERLAGALKAVEAEKWALVFLQNERLPLLSRDGRLFREAPMLQSTITTLRRFMEETERQFQLGTDVMSYLRDLRPVFVGANATYHVFLSDGSGETLSNEHLQWQPVFSTWEGAFRQVSADTGGQVSNTTRLGEALGNVAEREDVYYVLTFKPAAGGEGKRDIRVDMKQPGWKAVYSRKLRLGELFPLKIQALEWRDGRLSVSLADYQRTYGEQGLAGRLKIGVRAGVRGGAPLSAELEVAPDEPAADVELALNFPAPGRYPVHVDVRDLLTGNAASADREVEVLPPPAPSPTAEVDAQPLAEDLATIMAKTAEYCRRLKEAAFRFYCLEKVEERTLERNPLTKRTEPVERRWEYDYQITGAGGRIQERRHLLRKGTRKVEKENVALATRFSSHYSVFLPVTLLANENRELYSYRLVGRDRVGRSRCVVVEVTPRRAEGGGIAQGTAWIDEKDGSVLRIEMNPRGVAGAEALEKAAAASQARLLLEVTHQYFAARDGLRFPSMTLFREAYIVEKVLSERSIEIPWAGEIASGATVITIPKLEQKRHEVEFYRLRQDYSKYRFFEVDSSVEVKQTE